jgi:hypothetical protein
MAWPKGQKRPDAFKVKTEKEPITKMSEEESREYRARLRHDVSLPISEKLSDVIKQLKEVLKSYRHDIEVTVKEQSNVTTSIEVRIVFLTR